MTIKKFKLILALAAAAVLGIIILQNREAEETKILFFSIIMPRALLLFLAALLGAVFGSALTLWFVHRKK